MASSRMNPGQTHDNTDCPGNEQCTHYTPPDDKGPDECPGGNRDLPEVTPFGFDPRWSNGPGHRQ
jgi:hypothetical protein